MTVYLYLRCNNLSWHWRTVSCFSPLVVLVWSFSFDRNSPDLHSVFGHMSICPDVCLRSPLTRFSLDLAFSIQMSVIVSFKHSSMQPGVVFQLWSHWERNGSAPETGYQRIDRSHRGLTCSRPPPPSHQHICNKQKKTPDSSSHSEASLDKAKPSSADEDEFTLTHSSYLSSARPKSKTRITSGRD